MTRSIKKANQKPEAATTRNLKADEFEADTSEERPVALLAQRRRQFLAKRSQTSATGEGADT